jgi:MoaA/NifB/PqqE/SkfB family radical SAM enzyme
MNADFARRTRQESFGTVAYEPSQDRFYLDSTLPMKELLPQKLSAPLSMHWLVTLRCNARCPYCYLLPVLKKPKDREEILSREEVEEMLRQFNANGISRLYLTGGEPTLHPFLDEIIGMSHKQNIRCVVNTNGIEIPPKIYSALVNYGSRLSISLDSPVREDHNLARRQNSFDSIVRILENAARDKLDTRVISVLQQTNPSYWINFGKFLAEKGVGNWFIQAETTKQNELETKGLEEQLKAEFPQMRIRVLSAIFDSFFYILPDGTAGSDFWMPAETVYGKLPQDTISEIWNRNKKNRVQDHQGILHINEARGLQ